MLMLTQTHSIHTRNTLKAVVVFSSMEPNEGNMEHNIIVPGAHNFSNICRI